MNARGLPVFVALGVFSVSAYSGGSALNRAPLAAAPAAALSAESTGAGAIAGRVSFSGTPPPPKKVQLSADPKCAAMHKDGLLRETVRVRDGGLADVLVYVKSGVGGSYPAPAEPVLIDQLGCQYNPSMVGVMTGQPVLIRNSDDTLHNIHPRPAENKEFNIGQPRRGAQTTRTFDKPELMIPIGCDVHPWMRAYISVLAHPFFAVTKDDGSYEIKSLPDGEYEVEAIHSQLKSATGKATVKGGQATKLDFSFKG